MKWYRIIIPPIVALSFSSCAIFRPATELEITPSEKVNEVRDLLAVLTNKNESLRNFKGVGNIKLKQNGHVQLDQRVAWIGEKPVKLRIAVMISGYPAIKLATDGEWLYYLEARGNETRFNKIPASNPSLKRIISIPISSGDVVMLLAGRVPLPEFDSVTLIEEKTIPGCILVLKKKWWGVRQKIYLDESISRIRRIDVFHRSGSLLYRAEFKSIQRINGFDVPLQLRLSTVDGTDFQLDIQQYWVNVDPPPSVFVLKPPK
jgi:hypothetical protein